MKKIYLLFIYLLLAGIPASAQLTQTSPQFLQAIRRGQETILLSKPIQIPNGALQTALSGEYLRHWREITKQLQTTQSQQDQEKQFFISKKLSDSTAPNLSDVVNQAIQRHQQIDNLQQNLNKTLYHWGQVLDNAHLSGYTQCTEVNHHGTQSATLTLNGRTALIQDTPGKGFIVYPDEIATNASTIKAVMETYELLPEILSQDKPENIAGWFYLRANFKNALEEFEAAKEAYTSLQVHHGLLAGVQNYYARHTEQGTTIIRNYNYAAANLSLYSAKMLQFMSAHKEIFSEAVDFYKQIMQLHNENSATTTNFQRFWNQALIPAI